MRFGRLRRESFPEWLVFFEFAIRFRDEALQVLDGTLSQQAAIAQTTRRTQQFAKRQRTWFRRQHQPHWLADDNPLSEAGRLIEAGLG